MFFPEPLHGTLGPLFSGVSAPSFPPVDWTGQSFLQRDLSEWVTIPRADDVTQELFPPLFVCSAKFLHFFMLIPFFLGLCAFPVGFFSGQLQDSCVRSCSVPVRVL